MEVRLYMWLCDFVREKQRSARCLAEGVSGGGIVSYRRAYTAGVSAGHHGNRLPSEIPLEFCGTSKYHKYYKAKCTLNQTQTL